MGPERSKGTLWIAEWLRGGSGRPLGVLGPRLLLLCMLLCGVLRLWFGDIFRLLGTELVGKGGAYLAFRGLGTPWEFDRGIVWGLPYVFGFRLYWGVIQESVGAL